MHLAAGGRLPHRGEGAEKHSAWGRGQLLAVRAAGDEDVWDLPPDNNRGVPVPLETGSSFTQDSLLYHATLFHASSHVVRRGDHRRPSCHTHTRTLMLIRPPHISP